MGPNNIREMFLFRTNKYDLRGFCKVDQPTYFSRFMHRSYQYQPRSQGLFHGFGVSQ